MRRKCRQTPGIDLLAFGCVDPGFHLFNQARLWALVEAAQRAVKSDPHWKVRFQELQKRMHRNQTIVAIARQLLELVWHVLTRIALDPKHPRKIASEAELLTLRPELTYIE